MSMPLFQEIHIENTNSCGYKCAMCPRDQHTRKIGFMSLEDFSFLLERIGPFQGMFHLHGFGEPLLDRQLIAKIQMLKEKCPAAKALTFSTLGVKLSSDFFPKFVASGLDRLVISLYGFTREDYEKIHGCDGFERVLQNLELLAKAMKGTSFQASIKIPGRKIASALPVAEPPERAQFCNWAQDLGFEIREWSYLHNYGDGRSYNLPDTDRICPVINGVRRNILNITWDFKVIPCCYDFNATIPFGSLRENSLEEIFSSPEYFAFLMAHQTGNLSAYPVCQNCEKNDYT